MADNFWGEQKYGLAQQYYGYAIADASNAATRRRLTQAESTASAFKNIPPIGCEAKADWQISFWMKRHLVVRAEAGGVAGLWIVDTGAEVMELNSHVFARKLKHVGEAQLEDFDGRVSTEKVVSLPELHLQGAKFTNLPALLSKDDSRFDLGNGEAACGILGMQELSLLRGLAIDFRRGLISSAGPLGNERGSQIFWNRLSLYVKAKFGENESYFCLDTGSDESVFPRGERAECRNVTKEVCAMSPAHVTVGGVDQLLDEPFARVDGRSNSFILGLDFLARFENVQIDFRSMRLLLVR